MRASPCFLAAIVAFGLSQSAAAEELTTPTVAPSASVDRPARGLSMEKVEAQYGAPSTRAPAVGQPPITRWEYPGFVVYFEHQIVLHAVVRG